MLKAKRDGKEERGVLNRLGVGCSRPPRKPDESLSQWARVLEQNLKGQRNVDEAQRHSVGQNFFSSSLICFYLTK